MRSVLTGIVLPAVLVLGAVGGGTAYTVVTVDGADRTVPTTVWADAKSKPSKDPAENARRGRASTPLSKLLLPVPDGYRLGPDFEEYGNDVELSGKQATALMKEWGHRLSGNERRAYEKQVDKYGVQGIAVRTFATEFAERGGAYEQDVVITVEITRMKNTRQVRDAYKLQTELVGLLDLPKGPKIKGHKNVDCFVGPKAKKDEAKKHKGWKDLDGMQCFAYDSELLVSVNAVGMAPFDKTAIADMVQEQLDHIASPGEYV